MNNTLEKYINDSPLVKAAVTEAIHRYYYDKVLYDKKDRWKEEEKEAFAESRVLIDNVWNIVPNWRYVLLNAPKRYQVEADTLAVSIYGKPKELTEIELKIKI